MNIEAELSLMAAPIVDWASSVNKQAFAWSVIGVVFSVIFRTAIARAIFAANASVLRRMSIEIAEELREDVETALRVIIVCLAVLVAFQAVRPPEFIYTVLENLTLTVIVIAVFAAWYNLAAVFLSVLNPKQLNNLVAETDWAVRVTRFVIILLGITALLQLWNIDVSAAITGVGVLGAGVAIAAQDILKNFFGGMSNVSEKRFVTGDWIHVDGVAEGQVKQIDLRSTTIIGFDRVPRYIPNADLANATVQNLSRRDHRRISWVVPIVLSATVEQIESVCSGVRAHLQTSGDFVTREDMLCLIQVAGISDSAVDLKIYAFTEVSGYEDYLKVCERLSICILKTVEEVGTSLAYPTQSLHFEPALDKMIPG
jgi:MscS family membrane protein